MFMLKMIDDWKPWMPYTLESKWIMWAVLKYDDDQIRDYYEGRS